MVDSDNTSGGGTQQDLKRCRDAIDAIDREMLKLLNERAKQAQVIGSLKGGSPAYRPEREAQVLRALQEENRGPLPNESVAGVFRQVISACLALEQRLRIAYLGPPGTFSHSAVARHFGDFILCALHQMLMGPTLESAPWVSSEVRSVCQVYVLSAKDRHEDGENRGGRNRDFPFRDAREDGDEAGHP